MKGLSDKLQLIFKPFAIIAIGFILAYTFLHWLLVIKFGIPLKEEVINYFLPFALVFIPTSIWLRPRIKLLKFGEKARKADIYFLYQFFASLIIVIPTFIAQEYIITATGKLTELGSIAELNNEATTKYYTLKSYFIDKKKTGIHFASEVRQKRYGEDLIMKIYISMPIFENKKDASSKEPLAWLGIKYEKTVGWRNEQQKKEEIRAFVNKSLKDFSKKKVSEFVYLERIGKNSDDRDEYTKAIKDNPLYKSNEIIFVGINKPFEARNGKKLEWIFGSFFIGSLIWLIALLFPSIDENLLKNIKKGKPDKETKKEVQEFLDFLKPKDGHFVTFILVYINIGIYLLMVIMGLGVVSFQGDDLLNWGGNYAPLTTNGEWWRLLTSTFLHAGLMHLFLNTAVLLFAGFGLEQLLGRIKFLATYLLTGILASIASVYWHNATVSVGASGAIFGLFGVYLALILTKVYPPDFSKETLIIIAIFVGGSLLVGLISNIDNAVHIGGLLSGFVIGLILYPTLKQQKSYEKRKKKCQN